MDIQFLTKAHSNKTLQTITDDMKKNDIIELEITDITHEGSGIGKYEGQAVFVPNTAVGDVIKAHILKANKNYAFAKCNEIISPSKHRIDVDCGAFARCGGCTLRHINYKSECELKQNRVTQTMRRIGRVNFDSMPIIRAQNSDRYRNKAMYPISEMREIGFYSHHSHRVVACGDCLLHPEIFYIAGNVFTDFIKKNDISVYNEETNQGLVRHFYLREGKETNEIMVCVVINGSTLPCSDQLVADLKQALGESLKSVILNINTKKTNVVLGDKNICIYGQEYIFDILCGVKVRISPHSFYQVNHDMAEMLYKKAAEYAKPEGKNI